MAGEFGDDIHAAFQAAGVTQVAYVPDAGHTRLIAACRNDPSMTAVVLTTEEEGVALLAGTWLGGARGVLLMQSSGVGNCVNMFSLVQACRFPMALFITMRGQWHEFNPWQVSMGRATEPALTGAGFLVETAETAGEVPAKAAATLQMAFTGGQAAALLLHQRLMPVKTFGDET